MLNFTVGPVMSSADIIEVANHSTPYFRTPEFSKIMLENERLMLKFLHAPQGSRCVFLTASGTGAMESCVMNILNHDDKVIVINGGSFGQRFVELCGLHQRSAAQVKCEFGHPVKKEQLEALSGQGYTALLVNMDETSSGVLYHMPMIADFCKANDILLIVDAISAFIADELDMAQLGVAAVITGSQKALAAQPGISIVALSPEALARVAGNPESCMYLSMKEALKNMERGQTPFTPAVTILLQINKRLRAIDWDGGIEKERRKVLELTNYFRDRIKAYPFEFITDSMSNAVTALHPLNAGAADIVRILKEEYGIWACPNGGELADKIFRIGHIGHIQKEDYDTLFEAFDDMRRRNLL